MNSCPLCGSSKKRTIRSRVRYGVPRKVFTCTSCGMVYLERLPKGAARKFYARKTYRATYGPALGRTATPRDIFETYRPFQQPIIDELKGILTSRTKILDVGCSTGHFLDALKGKVQQRVGLELGKEEVAFIRKHLDFPVYDTPIEEADITEGPFDVITCLQVLEHIENPRTFLRSLTKHLKPGGYLYIEVPNLDDALLSTYEIKEYADFYYREPHLSYFSAKTLRNLAAKAGISGRVGTVQRYSIFNHMHWLLTGKPQGDFQAGNRTPCVSKKSTRAANDLNRFIQHTDAAYRKLLIKHGIGESLTFLGKKRS